MEEKPIQHAVRVRVRHYEMDPLGHVNNAVYLHYVEEAAIEHARILGFDTARWREIGGTWVVRRHEIDYKLPAGTGDELDVTTQNTSIKRVQATRRTTIGRGREGALLGGA